MKNDCFANYKNNLCGALKDPICQGPGCGFYKPHNQFVAEKEKADERLSKLDPGLQSHIMGKYNIQIGSQKNVS